MTVPQRNLVEALKNCARTEAGCEKTCRYAIHNEKFCQRSLLLAAARMIENLAVSLEEARAEIKEIRE